jgi:hypothetical protein
MIVVLVSSVNSSPAIAQSNVNRVELGAQVSLTQFRDIQSIDPDSWVIIFMPPATRRVNVTDVGLGIRAGYNLFSFLTIEGELNYFPHDKNRFDEGGRKLQVLYGAKAGLRKERLGLFGKFRPGFVKFSALLDCKNSSPDCGAQARNNFALDVGGVVEFYPSRRSLIRFDFGDTIIRQGSRFFFKAFPEVQDFNTVVFPAETTHNLQISIGLGVRF